MKANERKLTAALTSLWLILAVAVLCRVGYACTQVRQIPAQALASAPFESEAGNIAMALATGKGFSSPMRTETGPTAWLSPVYPFVVAGIFRVFGVFTLHAFYAAAALNILFSAATCVPVYFAGKRIAGVGAASLAAWLWALFPNAIMIPFEWIWDTSLTALLAASILWAALALTGSRRMRDWCAYGILWGFALLTNPGLGAALPFLFAWTFWRERAEVNEAPDAPGPNAVPEVNQAPHKSGRLSGPAAALGLAILCCVPWTARNYAEFHRFIPLKSNLPFDLWIGNNEVFDDRSPDINARVTRYEEQRRYTQLGETGFMQEKWNLATGFMRTHKQLEMRLTRWRFTSFWLGSFRPVYDFEHADSAWIQAIFALNLLTAIGSVAEILVLWRRRSPYAFPCAVFVAVFPLVYYATHASLRYRHPIDPIVLLLAAVAVTGAK